MPTLAGSALKARGFTLESMGLVGRHARALDSPRCPPMHKKTFRSCTRCRKRSRSSSGRDNPVEAPNVEGRGNAPLIDSESSSVVSEAEVMLDLETRQNIIREDDTNEKLILGEEGRVLDIDSSNLEHQSHYWYMFHRIYVVVYSEQQMRFYGGWPIRKPPDAFLPNLEQTLKEDAIYKAPGDSHREHCQCRRCSQQHCTAESVARGASPDHRER